MPPPAEVGAADVEAGRSDEKSGSEKLETSKPALAQEQAEKAGAAGMASYLASLSPEELEKLKRLQQMGLKNALAIAIHNFPEGMATFVATL